MSKQPVIILVDPQMGENIGMVARAMLNCGLTELRVVRPRDGWPSQPARDNAAGADIVIDGVKLYDTTQDAVADLQRVYATTGRPRGMVTRVVTPRHAAGELREEIGRDVNCGILFGGERSGLVNDDVALADAVISVPLNPDFKSLNLAQAVLLVAYEWLISVDDTPPTQLEANENPPASMAELDNFMSRLGAGLDEGRFFKSPEMRPVTLRNIRNLFQRAELTEQDVRTLHGIIKALRNAGPQG
ncbi:RNA methyltransferase [Aestuariispira insulae]|uniref:tRNA/rRNA methyltransferase n=1 Tax=Aestuariispira insulae TaxID=1461337 RepID=A0A3D9HYD1_9PROT|nr:RNA methyltransferase [Aestuariispira insulae]RED53916.1 tRNA/rRNA methyltransferase [Aestuariispira insulae]